MDNSVTKIDHMIKNNGGKFGTALSMIILPQDISGTVVGQLLFLFSFRGIN